MLTLLFFLTSKPINTVGVSLSGPTENGAPPNALMLNGQYLLLEGKYLVLNV